MSTRSVLMVDPQASGGICHYTWGLCQGLARQGLEVSLAGRERPPWELRDLPRDFRFFKAIPTILSRADRSLGWRRLVPRVWERTLGNCLAELATETAADVVHVQWRLRPGRERFIWEAIRRRLPGVPIIYTAHDIAPHDANARERAEARRDHAAADRVIVHGEALRAIGMESGGLSAGRTHVIPHGNYHFLRDATRVISRDTARADLQLGDDDPVILFFGYVRPYKGVDTLLHAVAKARGRLPNLKLLVAGKVQDGSWDSVYGRLTNELGLGHAIHVDDRFIPLADVGKWFAASDLVCLPYRSGSQSGALQLAYAFQRPVVASSVGALPEAIQNGVSGRLVPPECPGRLAAVLEELLSDRTGLARMGTAAFAWSAAEFGWERIAAQTAEVYEKAGAALASARS